MKMKKWSTQWTQFMQLRKEAWKKKSGLQLGLNPWPRDTGAMLYQLSYEATDVGSRSIVGSYVPVKEMSVNDIWNKSYMKSFSVFPEPDMSTKGVGKIQDSCITVQNFRNVEPTKRQFSIQSVTKLLY